MQRNVLLSASITQSGLCTPEQPDYLVGIKTEEQFKDELEGKELGTLACVGWLVMLLN